MKLFTESGEVRIIPIILSREIEMQLPKRIAFLHCVKYYKMNKFYKFWDILKMTLSDAPDIQANGDVK